MKNVMIELTMPYYQLVGEKKMMELNIGSLEINGDLTGEMMDISN